MKAKVIKTVIKQKPAEPVEITTEFIKQESLLKFTAAVETGGQGKNFILDGQVTVNGEVCLQRGKKLRPGDKVGFFGRTFVVTAGSEENEG